MALSQHPAHSQQDEGPDIRVVPLRFPDRLEPWWVNAGFYVNIRRPPGGKGGEWGGMEQSRSAARDVLVRPQSHCRPAGAWLEGHVVLKLSRRAGMLRTHHAGLLWPPGLTVEPEV